MKPARVVYHFDNFKIIVGYNMLGNYYMRATNGLDYLEIPNLKINEDFLDIPNLNVFKNLFNDFRKTFIEREI